MNFLIVVGNEIFHFQKSVCLLKTVCL